jgi:hypothetical protein
VTLNNPDRQLVKWRLDVSKLSSDKIFSVEPTSGIVPPMGKLTITANFNPYAPGDYESSLPLFIEDDPDISPNIPYVELTLKGESAFPRL